MNLISTLSTLYRKAIRKHIIYKALDNKERVLIRMIINNIKIVRNSLLATVIARLLSKLFVAINNTYIKRVIMLGLEHIKRWSNNLSIDINIHIIEWLGRFAISYGVRE